MNNRKTFFKGWGLFGAIAGLLLVAACVVALLPQRPAEGMQKLTAEDGSTLELKKVVFDDGYQYEHKSGPAWLMALTPLIPDRLESRFGMAYGSFGFGGPGTNLILITEWRPATPQSVPPRRVRIRDGQGTVFDAREGAHTLGMNNLTVNGWQLPAFPRRAQKLGAEFIGLDANDKWVALGSFAVQNPAGTEHPQWNPEPVPQSRTNGGLVLTLERFESGRRALSTDRGSSIAPRATRIVTAFLENDRKTLQHGVHRLTVSDATGNCFQPYLDKAVLSANWTRGGVIEFMGALWPGENAWKLEIETIQLTNHAPAEVWELDRLALPVSAGLEPTNTFRIGESPVKLRYLLAPAVTLTNDWQWALRYWGNEANVQVVGLEFPDGRQKREPVLVDARDEAGQAAKLVESRAWDNRHALFVSVSPGAKSLHLKLAFPELRKFEFLARPEFVVDAEKPAP